MNTKTHITGYVHRRIQEAFIEAIESGIWRINLCGRQFSIIWLTSRLWDCMDTMPPFICEVLCMPVGSTYAQGSRELRDRNYWLTSLPEVPPKRNTTIKYLTLGAEATND